MGEGSSGRSVGLRSLKTPVYLDEEKNGLDGRHLPREDELPQVVVALALAVQHGTVVVRVGHALLCRR